MGFSEHYGYKLFPIPFMRAHRNSLKLVNENDTKPLSIYNFVIPTAFIIGGYIIGLFAFIVEKVKKPKAYEDY